MVYLTTASCSFTEQSESRYSPNDIRILDAKRLQKACEETEKRLNV